MRHWLGERLRRLADRIDDDGAPRYMGYSFTFERGVGIVFRQDGTVRMEDHKGCPLMYRNRADYELAHERAVSMQQKTRPRQ